MLVHDPDDTMHRTASALEWWEEDGQIADTIHIIHQDPDGYESDVTDMRESVDGNAFIQGTLDLAIKELK